MAQVESSPADNAQLQSALKNNDSSLASRLCLLAAGCCVDPEAVRRRELDLPKIRRLGEAYRLGWLHNVMSRITPITLRDREDYVAMADLFVEDVIAADHLLDRFEADLATFCAQAGISAHNGKVPPELRAHVGLFASVNDVFTKKYSMEPRDPLANIDIPTATEDELNPYMADFVEAKFGKKRD